MQPMLPQLPGSRYGTVSSRRWCPFQDCFWRIDSNEPAATAALNLQLSPGHPLGPIRTAQMAAHSLVQNRGIRENPTSNGGMIDAQTTFCHHLFQIAIAQ